MPVTHHPLFPKYYSHPITHNPAAKNGLAAINIFYVLYTVFSYTRGYVISWTEDYTKLSV